MLRFITWLEKIHPALSSLMFASPWLIFLLFPLRALLNQPSWRAGEYLQSGLLLLMIGVYLAGWVVDMNRSGTRLVTLRAWPYAGGVFACQALLLGVSGEPAYVQTATYAVTIVIFRLPPRFLLPALGLITGLLCAEIAVFSWYDQISWQVWAAGIMPIFITAVTTAGIRTLLDANRFAEVSKETARQSAVADERARISADLHDILGQSLTTITVKAELAERLLAHLAATGAAEPGKILPTITTEVTDILAISRQSLADVRAVVRDNRQIRFAAELQAARALLQVAEIKLEVTGRSDNAGQYRHWDKPVEQALALTLREAVANIVHHSNAARCQVEITPTTVTIRDDGQNAGTERSKRVATGTDPTGPAGRGGDGSGGSGLRGARRRLRDIGGDLQFGPLPRGGWEVVAATSLALPEAGRE